VHLRLLLHVALALDYPTRQVRWIISAAPGGTADILARLMGAWLSERFGKQFIIESRPGAGGNVGAEAVVRAPPDGYTLHLSATGHAINASLYKNLNFNLDRDLVSVAGLIRDPFVMEVIPSFPAKTLPEFIAYAKANPGVINFGSGGVGNASHVAGELFNLLAGVSMVHVPYRGQGHAAGIKPE
jgi:tripartite-type tricarboxylate transporter receptor subunit TctC